MRTGSWAELALFKMNAAARLIASKGLRNELESLMESWDFFISDAGLFIVIVWLSVAC
jgi:hypothetical protein